MTYKKYDIITVLVWVILGAALIILGLFLRRPAFGREVWEVVMGVGVALAAIGIVSIAFSVRQADEIQCPYCGGKVVARVKSSTSELYLTKQEEEGVEEAEGEEQGGGEEQEAGEEQEGEPGSGKEEGKSSEE
jgi:DNA-directed RNA polymerase subunit RPC12/RpoP